MRRKLLLTVALAVLGTAITAAVVNAQQTGPSPSGVTLPGNHQGQPPVSSLPACSNGSDDDGDGLVDMADPGCSGPLDNDESDPTTPPPPGGGTGGGPGGGTGGGPGGGARGGAGGGHPSRGAGARGRGAGAWAGAARAAARAAAPARAPPPAP